MHFVSSMRRRYRQRRGEPLVGEHLREVEVEVSRVQFRETVELLRHRGVRHHSDRLILTEVGDALPRVPRLRGTLEQRLAMVVDSRDILPVTVLLDFLVILVIRGGTHLLTALRFHLSVIPVALRVTFLLLVLRDRQPLLLRGEVLLL